MTGHCPGPGRGRPSVAGLGLVVPRGLVRGGQQVLAGERVEAPVRAVLLGCADCVVSEREAASVLRPETASPPPTVVLTGVPVLRELEEGSSLEAPILSRRVSLEP